MRTDTTVKHDGISFLLIDMDDPGVEARPIKLISGASPFCETFLTDVKVPKENLVYGLNKGWTVAKRLLEHERSMISGMGMGAGAASMGGMEAVAKENFGTDGDKIANSGIRNAIANHKMDQQAFGLTLKRSNAEAKAGQGMGAAASMFKYYGTEVNKRRFELLLDVMGSQGLGWEGEGLTKKSWPSPAAGCAPKVTRLKAARRKCSSTLLPSAFSACRTRKAYCYSRSEY